VGERLSIKAQLSALWHALLPLATPVIIIGGIWTGWFTPTEAAAVGSLYAILLATLVYRVAGLRDLVELFKETMNDSVDILMILGVSVLYGSVLGILRVPYTMAGFLAGLGVPPLALLILVNVMLLILGFFMPAMVIINVFTPILVPVMVAMGYDPIFFGVVMVVNVMIGMLTPPFGIVLFTLSRISDTPLYEVIREITPFIVVLVIVLVLLIIFPGLVTFIPDNLIR
ncbi:MAG: TRAP transporter large permease subunit, partial [Spirochaetota bacterium]